MQFGHPFKSDRCSALVRYNRSLSIQRQQTSAVSNVLRLCLATLMTLFAAGCNEDDGSVITVGAVLSLQGHNQKGGILTFDGYELARKHINSKGGIVIAGKHYDLEIRYADDKSESAIATDETERMISDDRVQLMLGPYSSDITKAVARVTERFRVPMIAPGAASPTLYNRGNKYIFGTLSTADQYLESFIHLAATRSGGSDLSLGMAIQNDRFSLSIRAAIMNLAAHCGVNEIVIDDKLPREAADMTDTLTKVARLKPDIFIVSGHAEWAEIAAKQLEETGIHVPYLGITHCEAGEIGKLFPNGVEGAYCPSQWTPEVQFEDAVFESAQEFVKHVQARYPDEDYNEVPYQLASAAAAVLVLKDALERAGSTDRERVRDALSTTDLPTFYGRIRFAPNGQIDSKPMVLRKIIRGQYHLVDTPIPKCAARN